MSLESSLLFDPNRRDLLTLGFARRRGERRRQPSRGGQSDAKPPSPQFQPPDWLDWFNKKINRREAFGLAILTVTVIGGGYLAHRLGIIRFSPTPDQPDSENILPEGILPVEIVQRQLQRLNKRLLEHPDKVAEIAPQIGSLAIRYFCQEMNSTLGVDTYNAADYTNRLFFEPKEEYLRKVAEESGCTQTPDSKDEFAHVSVESNTMHFNTTIMFYQDEQRRIPDPAAANWIFAAVIHEAHHATAPNVDLSQPQLFTDRGLSKTFLVDKKRGLVFFALDTDFAKPNRICYRTYRHQLEEAIVQHSTDRMIGKLNFNIKAQKDYARWVANYEREIVGPLFSGNRAVLLRHHQSSKDTEFFQEIGKRVIPGAPIETLARIGEDAAFTAIVQGLPVR